MKLVCSLLFGLLLLITGCEESSKSSSAHKVIKETPPPPLDTLAVLNEILQPHLNFQNLLKDKKGALESFFSTLETDSTQSTHIAYYGDSQIEGDRITTHIRKALQQKWGGKGVGFIDFDDIASNVNVARSNSGNWMRNTVFKNTRRDGKYGIGGTTSHYSGDTAWIIFNLFNHFYYDQVYLIYEYTSKEPCTLNYYDVQTGKKLGTVQLNKTQSPQKINLENITLTRRIKLEFTGNSPLLYGLWVDGKKGVQLDNYSLRGHAGYGLLGIQADLLKKQIALLNTKLIVLHYGANEAPYVNSEQALNNFETQMSTLISQFRKIAPETSILLVSVGDMGNFRTGISHPYLDKMRDIQKKLAEKYHCAFWDVLSTMGGKNAVQEWRKTGLAAFDGHFTPDGQEKIGMELAEQLSIAFDNYQKKNSFYKNPNAFIKKNSN